MKHITKNKTSSESTLFDETKIKEALTYTNSIIDSYQKSKYKTKLYYAVYTLLFILVCLMAFSWFYLNHRSFIWSPDGIYQHYNALAYYGEYLRDIVDTWTSTGKLTLPLWNFNLGYGSDIITTLHYYVIGDPLCLLSFFVKREQTEVLYHALILLRLYLSGLTFSMFCHRMKSDDFSTLVGSLTYTFCLFSMYYGIRHPYFINPLIYLPLLLIGIEKIFHKEKPYLFIFMTFLSTVSNFYFFYMLSIIIFIYSVIRFFHIYKQNIIKNMLLLLGKFIGFYFIGVAMACFIFFPIVIAFLSSSRILTENHIPLLYNLNYYETLLSGFFSASPLAYSTLLGFFAVAFLSIILLFSQRKENRQLIAGFCLLVSFLLIPYVGHVLNGFSYIGNRWVFGLVFLIAFIVVKMMPTLLDINIRFSAILFLCTTAYFFLCFMITNSRKETIIVSLALTFMLLFLLVFSKILRRERGIPGQKVLFFTKTGVIIITVVGILSNSLYRYSPVQKGYVSEFIESGTALNSLTEQSTKVLDSISDTEFYRYDDRTEKNDFSNAALLSGKNSVGYYFSLENGNISNFFMENGNAIRTFQRYSGLDNRMFLEALASIKYCIVKRGGESQLSSGFTKLISSYTNEDGTIYDLYYNTNTLPLGYTYSSYITKDRFLTLNLAERQQALIQGVVLDKETSSVKEFPQTSLKFTHLSLPFEVETDAGKKKNIEVQDGKIIVRKEDSQITLQLKQTMDHCETYVIFKNLKFSGYSPREIYTDDEWEKLDTLEQNNILRESKFYEDPNYAKIQIKSNSVSKNFTISTKNDSYYVERENCLINLCYSPDARDQITLTFSTPGEYTFDQLQVVAQPLSIPTYHINTLKQNVLENVSIGTNTVTGTISLDRPKILCLSIPYSDGWSAKVDGVKTKILKANTMYMCIPLKEGEHTIQLDYQTPGLSFGVTLTKIGFFVLFCKLFYDYAFPYFWPKIYPIIKDKWKKLEGTDFEKKIKLYLKKLRNIYKKIKKKAKEKLASMKK
ncbi:MAG: YfhO family protein [Lachnospiraceae bacterium]